MTYLKMILLFGLFNFYQTVYADSDLTHKTPRELRSEEFGGCRIKLTDPYDGRLSGNTGPGRLDGKFTILYEAKILPSSAERFVPDEIGFPLTCYDIHKNKIQDWAKYDEKKHMWMPRIIEAIESEPRRFLKAKLIYSNSQRFIAVTNRDEYQDMYFCVAQPPKAVCGSTSIMRLNIPKSNVLPYLLKILYSIEFIEDAEDVTSK
ncbi:hypothetical protein [Collimonas arenae]|uniref:hypothetical protein n=1 Tax=Collimonas arenae TaxID=279058 RepID=UPI000571FDD6|nr:hypothetical protein [Collimonas arenae]